MYNKPSVPEAQLLLYGSSATGFASSGSDLDIACDCTGGGARPLNQGQQRRRMGWLFDVLR